MAIRQTGISYYGLNYVEHAEKDFQEMLEHGCNTVILAITEFDMNFWYPSIPQIVKKAKEMGLKVLLDPWGIGKYFGGEQVSLFLQNNINNRQVSAMTGEKLPAACFNTNSFRDYFQDFCLKLARDTEADGFFWDEPHYALPKSYASITGGAGEDWTCRCDVCKKKFFDYYGYEITMCVHATINTYYVTELRGYDKWDMVAASPYFDVFSTTILNWELPLTFFKEITRRTVETAQRYGKQSERWIMNYYKQPEDFSMMDKIIDLYDSMGVDRIAAWTYRGGYGTVLAAPDALKLWDRLGENYKRVLKRQ